MKEDPINVDQPYQPPEGKRTRKVKAPTIQPTNRSTRRAHRKHSADQCPLPEVIPLSEGQDLLLFQSYERELTRLVIQLPMPLLTASNASSCASTRVQATPIDIEVQTEGGNVVCKLRPGVQVDEEAVLVVHGRYSWLTESEVISKIIKSTRREMHETEWSQVTRFRPEGARSDGFIVLILRWEERLTRMYRGLVNQGNTCYMNSYLQMLFHLVQFRKLLFASQVKEKDRFPATLQLLFYRMLSEQKPVSPEQLVRSFGWSKKQVQVQHDAQQFSCLFFDALERTVNPILGSIRWNSVPELFCGELVHYIQCINVGTFRTQNRERFYDLQLPIANTLTQSLNDYVGEQKLQADNAYRTELFGLQDAHKGLKISFLPPVLMLQLKRFQFNPYTQANEKVLDRFAYPQSIDFAPWTQEPQVSKPYELYAVLVHEGSQASSGHYYVFIRMEGQWFRFNDERVEQVDRVHALDYNFGGSAEVVEYDSKQMKVVQKQVQNKATAYMLVYLSKQYSQQLTEDDNKLPEWLVEHTKMKLTLDEQKKLRKQSICDIPVLRWRDYESRQCLGSGLTVNDDGIVEEKIEMVPKNQKMEEWLEQLEKRKEKKEETLYLLWNVAEREAMVNIRTRSCTTVSELFKDIADPTIFYAPIQAQKDEFLVVMKIFDSTNNPKFYYGNCLTIKKDSRKEDLFILLNAQSPPECKSTYYIEDKKQGLIKLGLGDNDLLPAASPSRNQLLIVIAEYNSEGEVRKLYDEELDTVSVTFRCQQSKQNYEMELSKRLTVQQLRELIFAEIQKDNQGLKSPQNIVLKYKGKRTGKATTQANDDDLLSELVKVDKVVLYGLSAFNSSERHLLKEVTLHCRDDGLRLSEPIKIIVERAQQDKLLELAEKDERVQALLPKREGLVLRSFLLGRDRSYITDIVDEHGRVPNKGDLATVLERDKNSVLVLQQTEENVLKPQQRMTILLHHLTKTGERFSAPRIFILPRNLPIHEARQILLQQIQMQTYEFQGKSYNFHPFKLRMLAYLKDISKAIELQEETMEPEPTPTEGEEVKVKNGIVQETLESKFPKSKFVRVAVTHNYIAKGSQVLKLNVE